LTIRKKKVKSLVKKGPESGPGRKKKRFFAGEKGEEPSTPPKTRGIEVLTLISRDYQPYSNRGGVGVPEAGGKGKALPRKEKGTMKQR